MSPEVKKVYSHVDIHLNPCTGLSVLEAIIISSDVAKFNGSIRWVRWGKSK